MLEFEELDEKLIYGLNDQGLFDELECDYMRVVTSFLNLLVYYKNEIIGIVNFNTEYTKDFIFIDLYITKKYQNKGLGKVITYYVVDMFKNNKELLVSQTKENNIQANKVLSKLGNLILKHRDNNYYLLSDLSKLTSELLQKLIDHRYYGKPYDKQYVLNKEKDYTIIKNN